MHRKQTTQRMHNDKEQAEQEHHKRRRIGSVGTKKFPKLTHKHIEAKRTYWTEIDVAMCGILAPLLHDILNYSDE